MQPSLALPAVAPAAVFRVWIVRFHDWAPRGWWDVPPEAVVLEPAGNGLLTPRDAELFLKGFNGEMLARKDSRWAVRRQVRLRYDGDLTAGETVHLAPPATPAWGR